MPTYPDTVRAMIPGDEARREKTLLRHRAALDAVLHSANGASVLIVGHGATHDFVAAALCPEEHLMKHHTPYTVEHCSITEIMKQGDRWKLVGFGSLPWY